MKLSYQGQFDMPQGIRDPQGQMWIWDAESHTMVPAPTHDQRPDRGHATGGDNDLFDPFTHTEQPGVPELEGYMASVDHFQCGNCGSGFDPHQTNHVCPHCHEKIELDPSFREPSIQDYYPAVEESDPIVPMQEPNNARWSNEWAPQGKVNCPNCMTTTGDPTCPSCGKDLTPEWNQESDRTGGDEFQDVHPPFDARNEFYSDPERVPKRNREKTDDSFPSMNLSHIAPVSSVKPRYFSHVDEELGWREANDKNLSDCPECSDVMHDQDGEKVCHGCGHKQKIITAGQHTAGPELLLAAPMLEGAAGALGGEAAGGAAGGGMGGMMGGGGMIPNAAGIGQIGRMMGLAMGGGGGGGADPNAAAGASPNIAPGTISHTKEAGPLGELVEGIMRMFKAIPDTAMQGIQKLPEAMSDPTNPLSYADDLAGAVIPHGQGQGQQAYGATFGNDDVGTATKNDGSNSDPEEASNSGTEGKEEQGDGPEQLKDVDGIGGSTSPDQADQLGQQGDPQAQDKALKAFHMNMPLVIEFSQSPESGTANPILLALDSFLEEAFPGYRGGLGDGTSEHPQEGNNEAPSEDESGDAPDEGDSKEKPSAKEASLWAKQGLWSLAITEDDDPEDKEDEDQAEAEKIAAKTADMMPQTQPQMTQGQPNQWGSGSFPGDQFAPGAPGVAGAPQPCTACGQNHAPGTPCVTDASQNVPQPMANGAPVATQPPNTVTTKWEIVSSYENINGFKPKTSIPGRPGQDELTPGLDDQQLQELYMQGQDRRREQTPLAPGQVDRRGAQPCQTCGVGQADPLTGQCPNCAGGAGGSGLPAGPDLSNYNQHGPLTAAVDNEFGFYTASDAPHQEQHHEHRQAADWIDAEGAPLQTGHDYDLVAANYDIPDKITVNAVYPDKISYTMHPASQDTASLPYHAELSAQEFQTMSYQFIPSEHADSAGPNALGDAPVRPGQDPTPQVDDLSTPSTVVSNFDPNDYNGSFQGDTPDARSWIREGGDGEGVAIDPELMAKFAGKEFSGQEQRDFINESGVARNLDKLDLEGTHYIESSLGDDPELALW